MPNQIPENIKSERLAKLDTYLNEVQREFNISCIDKTFECLFEGRDNTGKHLIYRTPYMQQCIVSAPTDIDIPTLSKIRITAANKASLRGEIVSDN